MRPAGVICLVLLVVLPGCRHSQSTCREEMVGVVTQRSPINPELRISPASLDVQAPQRIYWCMNPMQAQCRAAGTSGVGEMMGKESEALRAGNAVSSHSSGSNSKQTMLCYASVEARNLAAGTTLEQYYKLAELEAKTDLIRESMEVVNTVLGELDKMRAKGLKLPPEHEKLVKQRLDLAGEHAKAQLGILQVNGDLGRLLDWPELGKCGFLWPASSFDVTETHIDVEDAVAVGLCHRAQLLLITAMREDMSSHNLSTLLLFLRTYNGFLGMTRAEGIAGFVATGLHLGKAEEVAQRRQQLDELYREQAQAIEQEIRLAVATLMTKTKLVALARVKVLNARERLKDLDERKERGLGFPDWSDVRLGLIQAKADLIQEVMAWHTAEAKLRQAQGLLAGECGFTPDCPRKPHRHSRLADLRAVPRPCSTGSQLDTASQAVPALTPQGEQSPSH